jgi:hypothetical protein
MRRERGERERERSGLSDISDIHNGATVSAGSKY